MAAATATTARARFFFEVLIKASSGSASGELRVLMQPFVPRIGTGGSELVHTSNEKFTAREREQAELVSSVTPRPKNNPADVKGITTVRRTLA